MNGREIIVRVADLAVGKEDDELITIGLGSCVAIMLYDEQAHVGGLAHILLPSRALTRGEDNVAKVPHTAVPALVDQMVVLGAHPRRITARLAGGASMFANLAPPGTIQMGERNLVATRQVLNAQNIPLTGESVGGDYGRTVRLRCRDGRIAVSSVLHGVQHI